MQELYWTRKGLKRHCPTVCTYDVLNVTCDWQSLSTDTCRRLKRGWALVRCGQFTMRQIGVPTEMPQGSSSGSSGLGDDF